MADKEVKEDNKKKDKEKKDKEKKDEKNESSKKNSLIPVAIIVAVVIFAELAFVGFMIFSVQNQEKSAPTPSQKDTKNKNTKVGTQLTYSDPIEIMINAEGSQGNRYFKASFVLVYNSRKYPQLGRVISKNKPRFKDIAIGILSSKDINILQNYKLRERIKRQLLKKYSNVIPSRKGRIQDILINEWLIQ